MQTSSAGGIVAYPRKSGTGVRSILSLALFCFAGAGCAVERTEVGGGVSPPALAAQGAASGIPIQVDGKVGGSRGPALAAAVASAMPGEISGSNVHYAPCTPYEECPGDHVVWTFGPPSVRPASDYPPALHLNVDWFGDYRPSPDSITASVALFQDGNVVATAEGQVDAPGGAEDPAFRTMIGLMSRAIFSGSGWFD